MCKCRCCSGCCYWNCLESDVGNGQYCFCCAIVKFNSLTNMMQESCKCCCYTCFCCMCTGYGFSQDGISIIMCAPSEFDNEQAEFNLTTLSTQMMTTQSYKRIAYLPEIRNVTTISLQYPPMAQPGMMYPPNQTTMYIPNQTTVTEI